MTSLVFLLNLAIRSMASKTNKNYCLLMTNRREFLTAACDNSGSRHVGRRKGRSLTCHAEMKALKLWLDQNCKSSKLKKLRWVKVFSIRARLLDDGKLLLSNAKPCIFCYQSLTKWGFRKIYFSTENGNISKCDPKDSYKPSSGDRASVHVFSREQHPRTFHMDKARAYLSE